MLSEEVIKDRSSNIRRIALVIQYDGSSYCGWQRQDKGLSVQGSLEDAIQELDPIRPVKCVAAGRTDSGVHASGQVVHFDSCGPIPAHRWPKALNGRLPRSIRILEAQETFFNWHACYSAKNRRYRYSIFNASRPNLFISKWTWHKYQSRLNEDLMREALSQLLGTHDFRAFEKAGSNRSSSITTIEDISIKRTGDLIAVDVQATGFLYGMVRLLMGQLVAVGEKKLTLKDFEKRWKEGNRSEVRESAPPNGLCLIRVGYDEKLFSKEASLDTFPGFLLENLDTPKNTF